jgi:hypothetical protein
MLEPRRSRYLRALGIDVYVPRAILPGARPSIACEWESEPEAAPVADEPCAAQPVAEPPAIQPQAARPRVAAVIDLPQSEPPARRVERDAGATPPAPTAKADAGPQIALGIALADGILIVDDAPGPAERGDYRRLLGNILFALRSDAGALASDVFLWPMLKQPQLDRSAAAARETLAAYIQNQMQRHAVHTVLLLGDAAQQWVEFELGSVRCVRSTSALACLRAPDGKRRLWHDIRHLASVH